MVTVPHPTPHAKRHLDRSSRFRGIPKRFIPDRPTDRPTDGPTDRRTDRPTDHGNVSSNTPHRNANAYTMRRNEDNNDYDWNFVDPYSQ